MSQEERIPTYDQSPQGVTLTHLDSPAQKYSGNSGDSPTHNKLDTSSLDDVITNDRQQDRYKRAQSFDSRDDAISVVDIEHILSPEERVDWGRLGLTADRLKFVFELIAEAIGTFFLILVGDSASAMTLLFQTPTAPGPYLQAYFGVAIAWGLAVAFAIYGTGAVSGAHLNPAVTLSVSIFRGFPKWKVLPYIIAQCFGCFVGAYGMWSMWHPQFHTFWEVNNTSMTESVSSANVFFTNPQPNRDAVDMFIGQIYQTAILLFGVFAVTDPYNPNSFSHNGLAAFLIGFLVAMIGGAFGFLEGWALNPARDFGPRLCAYALGFGPAAFPGFHDSWWPPIAGPLVGGLIGATLYEAFLRPFMPGIVAHGYTPFMRTWNRTFLYVFPKMVVGHPGKEELPYAGDINVGPGAVEVQHTGIPGFSKDRRGDRRF